MKIGFSVRPGAKGKLRDGRSFEVIEIMEILVNEDGAISDYFQKLSVVIDGEKCEMSVKELARAIDYDLVAQKQSCKCFIF